MKANGVDCLNEKNLKKFTSDQDREEAKKNGRKGGVASGKARRKKSDIKKIVQSIMDMTYEGEEGSQMTGAETMAIALFAIATNPNNRNCIQAQRLIYELTGQDKTPEDRKRIKQALKMQEKELELIQKKIDKDDDW